MDRVQVIVKLVHQVIIALQEALHPLLFVIQAIIVKL